MLSSAIQLIRTDRFYLKNVSLSLIFAVLTWSTAALPCTYEIISLADVGPGLWDEREDIPVDWVFVTSRLVEDDGATWWYREAPAGDLRMLTVEKSDGLIRIFPSEMLSSGQRYQVFSSRTVDENGAPTENHFNGVFTVTDASALELSPPRVRETVVSDIEASSTDLPCGPSIPPGGYSTTSVLYEIGDGVEMLLLRDSETEQVLDYRMRPRQEGRLKGPPFRTTGVLNFDLEAYDSAGRVAVTSGAMVVNRGLSCASGPSPARSSTIYLGVLLLLAFSFRQRGQKTARSPRRTPPV